MNVQKRDNYNEHETNSGFNMIIYLALLKSFVDNNVKEWRLIEETSRLMFYWMNWNKKWNIKWIEKQTCSLKKRLKKQQRWFKYINTLSDKRNLDILKCWNFVSSSSSTVKSSSSKSRNCRHCYSMKVYQKSSSYTSCHSLKIGKLTPSDLIKNSMSLLQNLGSV